jgi:hypothetical protein
LDLVWSGLEGFLVARLGDDGRILGLDRDRAKAFLARLNDFTDARDGSARANRRNKNVGLAIGVGPDFLGGGLTMDFRIGRVVKLLRNP